MPFGIISFFLSSAQRNGHSFSTSQVLRDFMRAYVARQRQRAVAADAQLQSRVLAERAGDPGSDEAEVMRWIEDVSDADGWTA
jgi:hypothetical protein